MNQTMKNAMKRTVLPVVFLLLLACVLSGCAGKENSGGDAVTPSVLTISGPTGMGMAEMMDRNQKGETAIRYDFTVAASPENVMSAVVSGKADIAACSLQAASKLWNKTNGGVCLLAVNTLGVLYVVTDDPGIGTFADLDGKTVVTSGRGSTPEYAMRYLCDAFRITVDLRFVDSFSTAASVLSAGECGIALLAEPSVSSVLAGSDSLRIALDLTEIWKTVPTGEGGSSELAQGCVLVRSDFLKEHPEAVEAFLSDYRKSVEFMTSPTGIDAAAALCETYGIVPKAAVAKRALPNCNIVFMTGAEMEKTASENLEVLYRFDPESVGGSLPGDGFCYETDLREESAESGAEDAGNAGALQWVLLCALPVVFVAAVSLLLAGQKRRKSGRKNGKKELLRKTLVRLLVAAFWIAVWEIAFLLVNKPLHLPSPLSAAKAFAVLFSQTVFWKTVAFSLLRIFAGFAAGVLAGILLAVLMEHLKTADAVLKPVVTFARTVPVVSVILLLWLVFFRFPGMMPVIISATMVFPIVWSGVTDGYRMLDRKLLEMADCYANRTDTLLYVKFPQIFPHFLSAFTTSVGLAWKAGIAAEVICQPSDSIGRELYAAKEGLEADAQFAWTAVVVLLSLLLEFVLVRAANRIRFRPHIKESADLTMNGESFPVVMEDISRHFDSENENGRFRKTALEHFTYLFPNGKVTSIVGESGCGKSTLLSIAAGIEADDDEKYRLPPTLPAVIFQEDRLIPHLTVKENLLFANRGADWRMILRKLGLEDEADKYPSQLSGGMKRRVAIGRAVAFCGGIGLFDEPFTGLDEETKRQCAAFLFGYFKDHTVLFVTHDREDAERYGDQILDMGKKKPYMPIP